MIKWWDFQPKWWNPCKGDCYYIVKYLLLYCLKKYKYSYFTIPLHKRVKFFGLWLTKIIKIEGTILILVKLVSNICDHAFIMLDSYFNQILLYMSCVKLYKVYGLAKAFLLKLIISEILTWHTSIYVILI